METFQSAGARAPAKLPRYILDAAVAGYGLRVYAARPDDDGPDRTCVVLASDTTGTVAFCKWLTAAEARLLAVYLVDCANAVDNPANRVIVDDDLVGEGIGHE